MHRTPHSRHSVSRHCTGDFALAICGLLVAHARVPRGSVDQAHRGERPAIHSGPGERQKVRSRRPLLNPPHAASLTCANRRLPAFRRLGTRGSAAARSPWAPWARRQPRWPLSQSPPRLCATLSELHFAAASAALRLWPLFGTPAALIPPFLPHVSPPITLFAPLTRAAAALHAREQSGVSRACLGSVRLYITLRPGPRERAESHAGKTSRALV